MCDYHRSDFLQHSVTQGNMYFAFCWGTLVMITFRSGYTNTSSVQHSIQSIYHPSPLPSLWGSSRCSPWGRTGQSSLCVPWSSSVCSQANLVSEWKSSGGVQAVASSGRAGCCTATEHGHKRKFSVYSIYSIQCKQGLYTLGTKHTHAQTHCKSVGAAMFSTQE